MNQPRPAFGLRQRWRRWWLARLGRSDALTLTQRNVYILPTRAGLMLALVLLVLLVASINFQLNLGYLLTFLLAGSVAISIHTSHATLRGLTLHLEPPAPSFAGASAPFTVQLHNPRRRPRYSLALAAHALAHPDSTKKTTPPEWAWANVPAQGSASVHLAFAPQRRGWHALPLVTVQTHYPLGTFRVWALWRPASQVLIYPRPEHPAPPLPGASAQPGSGASARSRAVGEFDGVRSYQRGDPLKLVVWKKAAQALASGSGELVSRDSQHSQRHELWLDAQATGLSDPEARLSRLTAWVLQAERLGLDYGLRLPASPPIAPASGPAQRQRCLQALALHGLPAQQA